MKLFLPIFILVFLAFGVYFWFLSLQKAGLKKLQVGSTQISVEIARTDQERAKGLSGRSGMDKNHGMLFVFPNKLFAEFWMKDMKFPLDLIWIAENRIVEITTGVQPPKPGEDLAIYRPSVPVDQVLEVNSDFTFFYQIKVGDQVVLLN